MYDELTRAGLEQRDAEAHAWAWRTSAVSLVLDMG